MFTFLNYSRLIKEVIIAVSKPPLISNRSSQIGWHKINQDFKLLYLEMNQSRVEGLPRMEYKFATKEQNIALCSLFESAVVSLKSFKLAFESFVNV